ncbi:MAG: DUF362 domain-containing protein [Candidatus Bathyarchaeota archaeon]|nr:MAG: DUF362 domain-containing protein [Candidatus Bathyarchaeota archaeon]
MALSKVAVVKGERGHRPVFRALDLIDYREALEGWERALVKVNFITTKTWDTGATTDPLVVEAIIHKLKELPLEVYVVESDATMTNADKAFKATGMREICERNGVGWINLRHEKERVRIDVPDAHTLDSIKVPRIVTESAIVSAAKMKTHSETQVTLGLKNMFGLLPDKFKGKFHARGIRKVITDINTVLRPVLTVIDGFVAMEGRGPVSGRPVKMDTIIAGRDVVATDATAARVMGFDPHMVGHIRMAHEKELGEIDDIDVVGDGVDAVRRVFARL